MAVTLLLGFLGAFLGLAAQALGLTFLKRARKRLHRHGSEQGVHVDRELDLPVGFRGKGVFAFVVGIDFGAFGLAAFDHIARVPLAVAVLVLDDTELNFTGRDEIELPVARGNVALLLFKGVVAVEQLEYVLRTVVLARDMDLHRGELLGVEHRILADDRVVGKSRR